MSTPVALAYLDAGAGAAIAAAIASGAVGARALMSTAVTRMRRGRPQPVDGALAPEADRSEG